MKVRDLIAALQEHDPDETVFAYREDRVGMGFVKLDTITRSRYYRSGQVDSDLPRLVIYGLFPEESPKFYIYDGEKLVLQRRTEKTT